MSTFIGNFVNPDVAPSDDFSPLPSGEYLAIITDSIMKATKAGTGQYLELTYQVVDGPMANRKVWVRLNLDNPNPKAVEIAQRDLNSIIAATGVQALQDSQQLHNIPHIIRVEFVPAGPRNDRDGNEVRAWKSVGQGQQAAPAAAAQPSPFQPPAQPAPAQPAAAASPPADAAAPAQPAWLANRAG